VVLFISYTGCFVKSQGLSWRSFLELDFLNNLCLDNRLGWLQYFHVSYYTSIFRIISLYR
jgi:hypothetical protein